VRKCSPRNCEPLLESYFPTTPNMICGSIPPPSDEHEYGYIPPPPSYLAQSSAPTNNTPPPPRSSEHDLPQNGYLPQSSGLTNTPASFLDWASGGAPPRSNEHQYSCLFSSPRESAKPLSRRDLRGPPPPHFSDPVSSEPADILPKSDSYKVGCDREIEKFRESLKTMGSLPFQDPSHNLIRLDPFSPMDPLPMDKEYLNKLSAIAVNEFIATAVNKLPGIGATATSMTGKQPPNNISKFFPC